jgi:uncharacterized protein YdaU (DUF1376 family)
MKGNKSPSFQFYPGDFLSDLNVRVMSLEELGAYTLLICTCWIEGSLPNDLSKLASIARMSPRRFERSWNAHLQQCFFFDPKKNVFRHKRLEKELKKQRAFRKQKSEAGKASALKRKKTGALQGSCFPVAAERALNSASTEVNSSTPSSSLETQSRPPKGVDDVGFSAYLDAALDSLRAELKLITLPNEPAWVTTIEWAFQNGFLPEEVAECFRLLRGQSWRRGRVSPRTVAENLPELTRLRGGVDGATVPDSLPTTDEIDSRRAAARSIAKPPTLTEEDQQK